MQCYVFYPCLFQQLVDFLILLSMHHQVSTFFLPKSYLSSKDLKHLIYYKNNIFCWNFKNIKYLCNFYYLKLNHCLSLYWYILPKTSHCKICYYILAKSIFNNNKKNIWEWNCLVHWYCQTFHYTVLFFLICPTFKYHFF